MILSRELSAKSNAQGYQKIHNIDELQAMFCLSLISLRQIPQVTDLAVKSRDKITSLVGKLEPSSNIGNVGYVTTQ